MQDLPEKLVFGLDIGTRSLVGTVGARIDEHTFKVFAIEQAEHETRAMQDGQIHDIPKVAESIRKMKAKLEAKLGRELTEVSIAAAGRVLKTVNVHPYIEFTEDTVIHDDEIHALEMKGVEEAYKAIRESEDAESDFYCVGYSVMRYYINGQQMVNLEEHKGTKIDAELIATFLPQDVVDDLYAAVENAGLNVANLTLEPIAAIDIAIPEKFRLLNIALVDVGAGTSDICITNDGCVIAYGMIPHAGDEITEIIARLCLVDFNTADKIKRDLHNDKVEFKDVMDITQTMNSADILKTISPTIESITEEIVDKIKELNGGKTVSAVFISSVLTKTATKGQLPYIVSKGAFNVAAKSISNELSKRNFRLNTIITGAVMTKMVKETDAYRMLRDEIQILPDSFKILSADEVANMTIFLLSDNARYIIGENYFMDGGYF